MNLLQIILLIVLGIGAFQGAFYGILLWRNPNRIQLSNRVLGSILFLLAYSLLNEILLQVGIGKYDLWYHLTLELNWAYGPLLYIFVWAKVFPDKPLNRTHLRLFWLVGLELLISIFVRSQNFFWEGTRESLSWLGYWGYVIWMNYPTKYFIGGLMVVIFARKGRQLLNRTYSNLPLDPGGKRLLKSLRSALGLIALYFFCFNMLLIIDMLWFQAITDEWYYFFTRYYYYPFFAGIAALTYALAFSGFNHWRGSFSLLPQPTSRVAEPEVKALAQRIEQLAVETDFFQQPGISISQLADHLAEKPYLVSKAFSQGMGLRFNDFVNHQRLKAFLQLVKAGKHEHLSLLGLAFEVGFNSKAAFQRAIRKQHNCSPSEFMDRIKKGSIG